MGKRIEQHPWAPFAPSSARLLMLGSFPPPQERWSMNFYYPNRQNDMWRILGLVFFQEKDHFISEDGKSFCESRIRKFCSERGIALSDTASAVIRHRDNASDKFLEVVTPLDLSGLLQQLPECKAIAVTGQKAADTLLTLINASLPATGSWTPFSFCDRTMRFYRMPSSSRAYPKPIEEKAAIYRTMFEELGFL